MGFLILFNSNYLPIYVRKFDIQNIYMPVEGNILPVNDIILC